MLKDPLNKNMLKFSYLASIKILINNDLKTDPIFTIKVEDKPITIKLSEIIDLLNSKEEFK